MKLVSLNTAGLIRWDKSVYANQDLALLCTCSLYGKATYVNLNPIDKGWVSNRFPGD